MFLHVLAFQKVYTGNQTAFLVRRLSYPWSSSDKREMERGQQNLMLLWPGEKEKPPQI